MDYLRAYFPAALPGTLEGVVDSYPDDAAAGTPFGTGAAYNWYPQFKRLGAILGDLTFTLTRRAVLATISDTVPCWSYLGTYFHGTPYMGTAHGTDILKMYFGVGEQFPRQAMWTHYISFINDLDPNTIASPQNGLKWPQWKNDTRQMVSFNKKDTTIMKDDFRSKTYDFLLPKISEFRV